MDSFMDRYGYYQIGDYKTYSIHQLMDEYHKNPQPYRWIYNDDFFSQYDWTQEPKESLNELYGARAKELREQYDYIVLYYSGGYDSVNMLYAFLDNGIYPDELIVHYSRYDKVSHQYHELKDITWSKIENIKKRYPKLKIRTFDYSDLIFDWPKIIADQNLNIDPIYLFGTRLSVNRMIIDVLYEYIDDWKKILKEGKKLCTVHGVDWVRLGYDYNIKNFVHNYIDLDVQGLITPIRQMTNKSNRDILEFAYWAPTDICAKIMIKQAHLAKKMYTNLVDGKFQRLITMKEVAFLDYKHVGYLTFQGDSYEPFKKVIYPRLFEDDEKYYITKKTECWWGNRDQWYYNSEFPNSKEHWDMYLSLSKENKSHWLPFFVDGDTSKGLKKIRSKDYII